MPLVPVSDVNGLWPLLKAQWYDECVEFEEDFNNYAIGTFSVLNPLASEGHPRCGIYALEQQDGTYPAFCQINRTQLPGYASPVLRVRMMTFSPKFDFGDVNVDDYAMLLSDFFIGVIQLSDDLGMEARFVNFHLRSVADRQFFTVLQAPLMRVPAFSAVQVKGMWLMVTKA